MDSNTTTLDLKSSNTFKMPTSEKTQNSQQNGTNYSNTSDVLEFKTIETEYTFEELLQVADKGVELNAQDDTWAVSYIQTTVDFLMSQEQNFADKKFVSTLNRVIEAYNNASGNRKALFEQYFPEQYAYFKWISNEYLNNFMPANEIIARIKLLETFDISIDTIEYIDNLLNLYKKLTPEQNKYLPETFEETTISNIKQLKEELEQIKVDASNSETFSKDIISLFNKMASGTLTEADLAEEIKKIKKRFFGSKEITRGTVVPCILSENAKNMAKEMYVQIDGKDVSIYDLYEKLERTLECYNDTQRLLKLYEDRDRTYRVWASIFVAVRRDNAILDEEILEIEKKWGFPHNMNNQEKFQKNPLGFIFSCVMAPVYGALDIVEGVIDLAIYASGGLCAGVTYIFDDDLAQDFLDTAQMMIEYDLSGAAYALNMEIVGIDEEIYNNSIAASGMVGGKLVGMAIITMVCPPAGAALITSSSLAGSAIEEAFLNGATYGEAGVIGAVTWTTSFVSGYVTNITTNYVIGISAAVLEPFFTSTFEYICYMDHVDENGNPVYKSLWDYYEKDGTYMDASLAALFAIWEVRQNKKKPPKGTTSKTTEVDNTTGGSKNLDDVLDDTTVKPDDLEISGTTTTIGMDSQTAILSKLQTKLGSIGYDVSNMDISDIKSQFPDEYYKIFDDLTGDERYIFDQLSGAEKYDVLKNSKTGNWITSGYDRITPENIDCFLNPYVKDGKLCYNLDWPKYAGYDLNSVTSFDDYLKKYKATNGTSDIPVSRIGSDTGVCIGTDQVSTTAQRSIPTSQSTAKTGTFHGDKYINVVDTISSGLEKGHSNDVIIGNLQALGIDEDAAMNLLADYNNFFTRPEMIGEGNIQDGLKGINKTVSNKYGYAGIAAEWNVGDVKMSGGAGQMNSVFSWGTLIESGIVDNVGTTIIK